MLFYFITFCLTKKLQTCLPARQEVKAVSKFFQNYGSIFSPETETSLFRKFEFLYCVFLAQVLQHKTEPCFVTKFPEGHSSLRLKKIILNSYWHFNLTKSPILHFYCIFLIFCTRYFLPFVCARFQNSEY